MAKHIIRLRWLCEIIENYNITIMYMQCIYTLHAARCMHASLAMCLGMHMIQRACMHACSWKQAINILIVLLEVINCVHKHRLYGEEVAL